MTLSELFQIQKRGQGIVSHCKVLTIQAIDLVIIGLIMTGEKHQ